jgi:hypothetical protein
MTQRVCLMTAVIGIVALSAGTRAWGGRGGPPAIDPESGKYRYREVVEVQGVSADELFTRARSWVATFYPSGKFVTQLDDEGSHTLTILGTTGTSNLTEQALVHHTLTLETKDGRYRYTIGDFTVSTQSSEYGSGLKGYALERVSPEKPIVKQTVEAMDALIADLVTTMGTGKSAGATAAGP